MQLVVNKPWGYIKTIELKARSKPFSGHHSTYLNDYKQTRRIIRSSHLVGIHSLTSVSRHVEHHLLDHSNHIRLPRHSKSQYCFFAHAFENLLSVLHTATPCIHQYKAIPTDKFKPRLRTV
ncbi:hypothetical protein BVRB_4g072660 [Beta vulgaris subsp. vulgaris]|nr:hypothetical protein BVRB_4g072660 [Beta vulgaris subsp. vulgaris]